MTDRIIESLEAVNYIELYRTAFAKLEKCIKDILDTYPKGAGIYTLDRLYIAIYNITSPINMHKEVCSSSKVTYEEYFLLINEIIRVGELKEYLSKCTDANAMVASTIITENSIVEKYLCKKGDKPIDLKELETLGAWPNLKLIIDDSNNDIVISTTLTVAPSNDIVI